MPIGIVLKIATYSIVIAGLGAWLILPILVVLKLIGRPVDVKRMRYFSPTAMMWLAFPIGLLVGVMAGVWLDMGITLNGILGLAGGFGCPFLVSLAVNYVQAENKG